MLIVGVDVETTGLNAEEDRITEIGAVLWEWETSRPLALFSTLVDPERPIPPEITKLTGIDDEMISRFGWTESVALGMLVPMVEKASYAMAHNAPFDQGFLDAATQRWRDMKVPILWLDTKGDIRYPETITTRNLRHLASEHGFLNPFSHRAVFDVLTMLKVASCYDLEEIIARAKEPTLYVQALVSFDEKDKAKTRGYYWCAPKKIWWRSFKASDYAAEKDTCGFRTALLPGSPE